MRTASRTLGNRRSYGTPLMPPLSILVLALTIFDLNPACASTAMHQYDQTNQAIVERGTQALVTCNGLFVSNRTLEQIYDQELTASSQFF